jgi:hypothetical protein
MKNTTILALTAALMGVAGTLNATPIYGILDLDGVATFNNSATAVTTFNSVTVFDSTFVLGGATGPSVNGPWSLNSGALNNLVQLTSPGFTFNLTSSTVQSQVGFLANVTGTGTGILAGYQNTIFNYDFTSYGAPTDNTGKSFDFTLDLTSVPDGGTTVALLGGALTALGLIRRKLVA